MSKQGRFGHDRTSDDDSHPMYNTVGLAPSCFVLLWSLLTFLCADRVDSAIRF
ncbi:MAG: hypothetical protein MPJ24_00705 [Pirellulaceae bacterium]|nr:hypothetical protein [Pirellulaceae bacterium]